MHRTILFFVLLSTYHNTAWTGETDQTAAIQADAHDEQLKLYSPILTSATNPAVSINPNEFLQRGVAYTLRCGSNAGTFWTAFRYCMGKTQQLASDESSQDSDRLAKFLLNNYRALAGKNVWLGGTDAGKRNSWIWLSELSPVGGLTKYLRWKSNEPSSIPGKNMCMVAVLENSEVKWKAQDCEASNCYVCQKYLT
ncbi:C-type lectin-like [Aedes albopictus]|uniref:C-type lectin domain-containing protein n=1 Tax=Aedes albopictus TaxID=7160 RepID=A0ABM1ZDZ9_AEDAL